MACRRTPQSIESARMTFARALGASPGSNSVALLLAHAALETDSFRAMYNWNYGNIGGTGDDGSFRYEECGIATPPGNPTLFAAYRSADSGSAALVSLLRRRYPEAWRELQAGTDPHAYVAALKARGYFTASLGPYQKGVERLYRQFGGTGHGAGPKADGC